MPPRNLIPQNLIHEPMLLNRRQPLEPIGRDLNSIHTPAPAGYILYLQPSRLQLRDELIEHMALAFIQVFGGLQS